MSQKHQLRLVRNVGPITAAAVIGDPKVEAALLSDFVAEIRATEDVSGALDVTIEDSFDDGVTWNAWIAFTQLTATGSEVKAAPRPHGGDIRARATAVTGTWSAINVTVAADQLR